MGNNNTRTISFRQSVFDFPLTVSLGKKAPEWGLARWGGNNGLRFIPLDDEGFNLRGDKRRLVYKGRRRSHRFTILSDGAFEYDCILEREPDSNVIALRMEGAEQYDFFRQPDFIKDPLLAGSYAVYKKETLLGEGTGKLCHIHRPEIIDARGRRCWGDLSVAGNCLCITIPEQWLSQAKYPVVVDPTIGTTTVGSQIPVLYTPSYNAYILYEYAANPFTVPDDFKGMCTAHVYLYNQQYGGKYTPIVFSDLNNKPKYRLTNNEQILDCVLFNPHNYHETYPPQRKTAQFNVPEKIYAGSRIWFGGYGDPFTAKFDYGSILYKNWPELICTREGIGEYYDENDDEWYYDEGDYIYGNDFYIDGEERSYNYLFSWYFDYTPSNIHYVRKITQGVEITDNRKMLSSYKRNIKQAVQASSGVKRLETFYRKCLTTAHSDMNVKRYPAFVRNAIECVKAVTDNFVMRSLLRNCFENVLAQSLFSRIQGVIREIQESVKSIDSLLFPVIFIRSVSDKNAVFETTKHTAAYIKTLEAMAGNIGETLRIADYRRLNTEAVQAAGNVFRGLLLFVRIVTGVFVRDYLIRRFLKAREELKLKSCISREITLGSKII